MTILDRRPETSATTTARPSRLRCGLFAGAAGAAVLCGGWVVPAPALAQVTCSSGSATGANATACGPLATAAGAQSTAVGYSSNASHQNATAVGSNAQAVNVGATAVGLNSTAAGINATALGSGADASGSSSVALGSALASQQNSIAIGAGAEAVSTSAIAIGPNSAAGGVGAIAFGSSAFVSQTSGVAIGTGAGVQAVSGVALGPGSSVEGARGTAVGARAYAGAEHALAMGGGLSGAIDGARATGIGAIAIGTDSVSSGPNSVALGFASEATAQNGVALGENSEASGTFAAAVGSGAVASGPDASALGHGSLASDVGAIALGRSANATAAVAMAVGYQSKATALYATAMGASSIADGEGAIASGYGARATGTSSVAVGQDSAGMGIESIAVGMGAKAGGDAVNGIFNEDTIAIGAGAQAGATAAGQSQAIAIGDQALANAAAATAIGAQAQAGAYGVALGATADAAGPNGIAIGGSSIAGGGASIGAGAEFGMAIGVGSRIGDGGDRSIAIGNLALASAESSVAVGDFARTNFSNGVAVGYQAYSNASQSTAIGPSSVAGGIASFAGGSGAEAIGNYAVAVGFGSGAAGANSIAFGNDASASANHGLAFGANAAVTQVGGLALGANSSASAIGAIALGSGSVATAANSLSIGAVGTERRIVNVAAGTLVSGGTDVVTGGQLFTTNQVAAGLDTRLGSAETSLTSLTGRIGTAEGTLTLNTTAIADNSADLATTNSRIAAALGGGAGVDADGLLTAPSYSVLGVNHDNVGGALTGLNTRVTTNSSDIDALEAVVASGAVGLVTQDAGALALRVAATTGGTVFDVSGSAGSRRVTGVLDGTLAAGGADAVTGGQLYTTNQFAAGLDARLGTAETSLTSLTGRVGTAEGTLTLNTAAIAANSADLSTTNSRIAAAVGGGAGVDADGLLTAPSYSVLGVNHDNVGGALTGLSTRVTTNSSDIDALEAVVASGAVGLVTQDAGTLALSVAATTGGTVMDVSGTAGGRRLTGVLDGTLVAGGTDAVTGGQLYTTNQLAAGLDTRLGTAETSLTSLGGRVTTAETDIVDLRGQLGAVGVGLVVQDPATQAITVASATGGTSIDVRGIDGRRKLGGVADADLSSTSDEAVTGAQLYAANQAAAGLDSRLGVAETGLTALDTTVTSLGAGVAAGTLGLLRQDQTSFTLSLAAASGGTRIDIAGTDGARTLSGLGDGTLAVGGTEAVTGGQLFTTNQFAAGLDSRLGTAESSLSSLGGRVGVAEGAIVSNTAAIATAATHLASTNSRIVAALGGGAGIDAGGLPTAPSYAVLGVSYDNVGGALTGLSGRVMTNTSDIDALETAVASGVVGLVAQDAGTLAISVAATTGGTEIDVSGTAGPRRLTGVADGALTAGGTDAVTGGQLYTTNQVVAGIDSRVTTAETSLSSLGGRVSTTETDIVDLRGQLGAVGAGLVVQDRATQAITVASSTGGTSIDVQGAAGKRKVKGVADGAVATASDEAVTGAQLFATNGAVAANGQALAAGLGGGAAYNAATGAFTAPSYVVLGSGYNNVGGALTALSGRVETNTTDIATIQAGGGGGGGGGNAAELAALRAQIAALTGQLTALTGKLDSIEANAPAGSATGANATAVGRGSVASGFGDSAFGNGARATGDPSVAVGYQALASGQHSTAIGGNAQATGDHSTALGQGAVASGAGSTALGQGASATYANSTAVGQGVATTRANQVAIGSAKQTYTLAGIASADSRAAQQSRTYVVTSDALGNLATMDMNPWFDRLEGLETTLEARWKVTTDAFDRQADGIALALALGGAQVLQADQRFSISANLGNFDGANAAGFGAIGRINNSISFNIGAGMGFRTGVVAGRAGVSMAW